MSLALALPVAALLIIASGGTSIAYDPFESLLQGSAAIGNAEMGAGQNMMPHGAPIPSQTYHLPPPVQQPSAVYAPNPYTVHQPNYNGYVPPHGPAHLNPNINRNNVNSLQPPPPPPYVHNPSPVYTYQPPITGFQPPRRR
jgi:hypothetical protein